MMTVNFFQTSSLLYLGWENGEQNPPRDRTTLTGTYLGSLIRQDGYPDSPFAIRQPPTAFLNHPISSVNQQSTSRQQL